MSNAIMASTLMAVVACCATLNGQSHDDAREKHLRSMMDNCEHEYKMKLKKLGPFTKRQGKERMEQQGQLAAKLFADTVGHDQRKQRDLIDAIQLFPDDGFAHLALCNMIDLLAHEGEAQQLRDLLSKRCPSQPGFQLGIEDKLIIIFSKDLKDGTVVLCDAFDRSADRSARRTIAEALRRGFQALVDLRPLDDRAAVAKVREWYSANSGRYVANERYLSHLAAPAPPSDGVLILKSDAVGGGK